RYADEVRAQFQQGVLADLLAHDVSVLKDPRLCLVLPLFLPVMNPAAAVFIVRHPLEVAMSLAARNKFSIPLGVALWEAYNRHALAALRGIPTVLVRHRRLMSQAVTAIPEIVGGLSELGIAGLDAQAALTASSINPQLYHQHAENTEHRLSRNQRVFWQAL